MTVFVLRATMDLLCSGSVSHPQAKARSSMAWTVLRLVAVWLSHSTARAGTPDFAWETHPGYRSAPLPALSTSAAGFSLLAPADTGVIFTNLLRADAPNLNQNLLNGSGLALGDY